MRVLVAAAVACLPLAAHAVALHDQGASGALRVALAVPAEPVTDVASGPHRWVPLRGTPLAEDGAVRTPASPGFFQLEVQRDGAWVAEGLPILNRVEHDPGSPLLGHYRIGLHAGRGRAGAYAPPHLFVEVTEELRDLKVSDDLRLGQFLTKDQPAVWPKYVPLSPALVDKLELVIAKLRSQGIPARNLHVMSGYRTPAYNGPGEGGRAKFSRHTYGDAADVWIDDDGDGRMDDLNHDGRVDREDAAVIARAAAEVEAEHPELVGGAGLYPATRTHGPFAHLDARGSLARWSR